MSSDRISDSPASGHSLGDDSSKARAVGMFSLAAFFADANAPTDHYKILYVNQPEVGLRAIVAIHDLVLGPSLGGVRYRYYPSRGDAIVDALRLSQAMTLKNALCGINFGGGKSVIMADSSRTATDKKDGEADERARTVLFRALGKVVASLGGDYLAAEDMGTSVSDMMTMRAVTEYVLGTDTARGGAGDPSPFTARGLMKGLQAVLERIFGSADFKGRSFAVQGVGHVGQILVTQLAEQGALVTVSDLSERALESVLQLPGVTCVQPEAIYDVPCDVFVPCAVGATVNAETALRLKCRVVAGAANNQLAAPGIEALLKTLGIVYIPDFAINAGGVILCADEREVGGFSEKRVIDRVDRIYQTVGTIIDQGTKDGVLLVAVAEKLAKERIERERAKKSASF